MDEGRPDTDHAPRVAKGLRDRAKGRGLSWEVGFGLSRWASANHEPLKVKEGKKKELAGSRMSEAPRLVLRCRVQGGRRGERP